MNELLPLVIVGTVSGSLYGLAGTGLVLTYRTSGIFNFAYGAAAAAGAYAFHELHIRHRIPWPLALVITVVVLGVLLGVAHERLSRPLSAAGPATAVVGTVGLLLLMQGGLTWRYGAETLTAPPFLPVSGFKIAGVFVGWDQLIVIAVATTVAISLSLFLRLAPLGAAMRAVVDDADLLALTGTSPTRVRTGAWIIGTSLAVTTGILIAPTLGVDAVLLTLLVVQAFGACAIGRFSNLPLTYLGGIFVGIAASLITKFTVGQPSLGGLSASIPFLVLFVVLLVTPRRGLPTKPTARAPLRNPRTVSRASGRFVGAALLVLAVVPAVVGARLPVWTNGLIYVVALLSLSLLVNLSGQTSLCQIAFAALGATTFSHLTGAGLPWGLALLGAGLAAVPLGALVAVPAIRLSGIYLAIATFGFGILMERLAYPTAFMFGSAGTRSASRPSLSIVDGTSDISFYYVVLAITGVSLLLVSALYRSQLGNFLRAMAESPTALSTNGLDVNVTRLLVFCIAAALAGVAGGLFVAAAGQVSGIGFGSFQSLLWLAVLAIAGRRPLLSPVIAAGLLAVAPAYLPAAFSDYQTIMFGALAVLAAIAHRGLGLTGTTAIERRQLSPVTARYPQRAAATS